MPRCGRGCEPSFPREGASGFVGAHPCVGRTRRITGETAGGRSDGGDVVRVVHGHGMRIVVETGTPLVLPFDNSTSGARARSGPRRLRRFLQGRRCSRRRSRIGLHIERYVEPCGGLHDPDVLLPCDGAATVAHAYESVDRTPCREVPNGSPRVGPTRTMRPSPVNLSVFGSFDGVEPNASPRTTCPSVEEVRTWASGDARFGSTVAPPAG